MDHRKAARLRIAYRYSLLLSELEIAQGHPLSPHQRRRLEAGCLDIYAIGVEDGWSPPTPIDEDLLEGRVPTEAVRPSRRPTKRPGR